MDSRRFNELLGRVIDHWCGLDGDSQGVLVATAIIVLVWLSGVHIPW